jgi:hypothetical protein
MLLALMALIVVLISFDSARPAENVEFLINLQSSYAVVIGVFTASSAIFNERKSRRILGVLAKGIERSDYLAGMLLGVTFVNIVYCLSLAVTAEFLALRSGLPALPVLKVTLLLVTASTLAATVSLFFSTLMHPMFAAASTGLFFGLSMAAPVVLGGWAGYIFPAAKLATHIAGFSFNSTWAPDWEPSVCAVIESLMFWQASSWVFASRDITVAIE